MGNCGSNPETKVSNYIDEQLMKDLEQTKSLVKLLLLGPGESGKSTILKQMRILHTDGFSPDEYRQYTSAVYCDAITSMVLTLREMERTSMDFEDFQRETDAIVVREFVKKNGDQMAWPPPVTEALRRLWADDGLQRCLEQATELSLPDSTKYWYSELKRIGRPDYIPSQDDLLRIRIRTTGIVEITFVLESLTFRVFDVGGQRSERKKWIHCFDDTNAIIFVASLSEYNQVLAEDCKTNRMIESIGLFETICNSIWFVKTNMILFLNKTDLFQEKIAKYPLTVVFPEYKGPSTYEATSCFVRDKYKQRNTHSEKQIYTHYTCATDTNQVQMVLESTIDTIVSGNLKVSGLY